MKHIILCTLFIVSGQSMAGVSTWCSGYAGWGGSILTQKDEGIPREQTIKGIRENLEPIDYIKLAALEALANRAYSGTDPFSRLSPKEAEKRLYQECMAEVNR